MRSALVLLGIVCFANCAVVKMAARKSESPLARMLRDDSLSDFLVRPDGGRVASKGKSPVTDHFDGVYSVEMSIGTPPQNFTMLVATAQTDTFVIDSLCQTDACTGRGSGYQKKLFSTKASDTLYAYSDKRWNIPQGASGALAADIFNVAGIVSVPNQEGLNQGFGLAFNASTAFGYDPVDGIFGLAWPSHTVINTPPVVWELLSQLDEPLFTIWMDGRINPLPEARVDGQITFGALDSEHCDAQVNYVPLSAQGYWQIPITRFAVGTQSQSARAEAILDSTNGKIGAPISALNAIIAQTSAKFDFFLELYTVNCKGTYPDIVLTIGGKQFNIPSSEYVVYVSPANDLCALAVYELQADSGFGADWSLGMPWMRAFCGVYDIGKKRMGFAKSRHSM